MLIFFSARLVLLAPPRTGSQALQNALELVADVAMRRPEALNRMTGSQYKMSIEGLLEDSAGREFRVAALVREPISWLGSWYRACLAGLHEDRASRVPLDSFSDFVAGYLAGVRPAAMGEIHNQEWFLTYQGEVVPTHLFAYEEIDLYCRFLEAEIGHAVQPVRPAVSTSVDLTLPPVLELALRRRLAGDFALHERARRRGAASGRARVA